MRLRLTWLIFALAVSIAACGGGGRSGLIPATGSNPGGSGGAGPSAAKTTRATIALDVPPASRQATRKPLYITSNTQAFGVAVLPVGSTATPGPSTTQVFPVATPSPCAAASGGGYACTLTVTAPIGNDVFFVAAFATASPGPNSIPISEFESGAIAVGASPAPGATPLSFTLNGVVYEVAIAVASPDPQNTPNTQVFTALVATSAPLSITAYDSSGNVVMSPASQPFASPVVIEASPAADGVSLSLAGGSSPCSSSASGSTATIECAADLNGLVVNYDGSTHPDSEDHVIAAFTIAANDQPTPVPSPATIVLASNVVTFPINYGGEGYVDEGWLLPDTSGTLLYAFNSGGSFIGTFTTASATASLPVELNGVEYAEAMAIAPNGTFWVDDEGSGLDCWSSVASALGGAAPNATAIGFNSSAGNAMEFEALAVDSANNVWIAGYDSQDGPAYAGYLSAASGCPTSVSTVTTQFALSGDNLYDSSPNVSALANGIAFNSISGGLYEITTSSLSPVSAAAPALGSGSEGSGVATDPAGNSYAAFVNYDNGTADLEWLSSGALTSIAALVPTNASVDDLEAEPGGLSVFSPTGGIADRASYVDGDVNGVGFVDALHTSPATFLSAVPNAYLLFQTAYGPSGAAYALYESYNVASDSYGLAIARTVNTTTWSVPVNSSEGGGCAGGGIASINERGDSGPFTVVASPAANTTIVALPGSDHDYLIEANDAASATVELSVTDKNGRTFVVPSFTTYQGEDC